MEIGQAGIDQFRSVEQGQDFTPGAELQEAEGLFSHRLELFRDGPELTAVVWIERMRYRDVGA